MIPTTTRCYTIRSTTIKSIIITTTTITITPTTTTPSPCPHFQSPPTTQNQSINL